MKYPASFLSVLFLLAAMVPAKGQEAMIGEIKLFAGNFAPRGWAYCNGQELPIVQNQALYSILGNTYGGDDRSTFKLPDLNGPKSGSTTNNMVNTNAGANVKSRTGGSPATVTFVNRTNQTVTAYWIDWEGKPINYGSIPSNQQWNVNTGTLQYWRFTHGQKIVSDIEVVGNKKTYDIVQGGNSTSSSSANGGVEVKYIICVQGTYPSRG